MYFFTTLFFLIFILSTLAYYTRPRWTPYLPYSVADFSPSLYAQSLLARSPFTNHNYAPLPSSDPSFQADIEHGLSSSSFDLATSNVGTNDVRGGLDSEAKEEIATIMRGSWCRPVTDFDEARRIYMERCLMRQGIGRDGMPKDPKFVSFG